METEIFGVVSKNLFSEALVPKWSFSRNAGKCAATGHENGLLSFGRMLSGLDFKDVGWNGV